MVSEYGLIILPFLSSRKGICINRYGAAIVLDISLSLHLFIHFPGIGRHGILGDNFGVCHLGEAQFYPPAARSLHPLETGHSDYILAKVIDKGTLDRFAHAASREGNVVLDGKTYIRLDIYFIVRSFKDVGTLPGAVVERALLPVGNFLAGIVVLAELEAVAHYWPLVVLLPTLVADYGLTTAVLELEHQLGEQALPYSIRVHVGRGEDVQIAVPAASEHSREGIGAFGKH